MLTIPGTLQIRLFVLIIATSAISLPCMAVIHGDVKLLKMIAEQNRANYESITTWKGGGIEEVKSSKGDDYKFEEKYSFTFAYDSIKQASRWNKETKESIRVSGGKSFSDGYEGYHSKMIKGQDHYDYGAIGTMGEIKRRSLSVQNQPEERSDSSDLNPTYFYYDNGGGSIYELLMNLYNNAGNPKLSEWYITKNNNLVTLQVQFDDNKCKEKYVFDISAGGNVIEYYNKTPTSLNVRKNEYEKISGVWVLKSHVWENITSHANEEDLCTTRKIQWKNSIVNVPFEEDEFTIYKLGVKPGDDIHDHRVGMRYNLNGTKGEIKLSKELGNVDAIKDSVEVKNIPLDQNEQDIAGKSAPSEVITEEVEHEASGRKLLTPWMIILVAAFAFTGIGGVYIIKNWYGKQSKGKRC